MERKLVTLRTIGDVIHHPNADKLDIVTVDGWQCVTKRDEFKVGDLCIYFEIDSVLPDWEEFEFMKDKKYRVRTIKLRGELSQGLALPLSTFNNRSFTWKDSYGKMLQGEELQEMLCVTLYEPKEASKDSHTWCEGQEPFPSYVPKTNQERIQNLTKWLDKWKETPFIVTEKLDGSSMTLIIDGERDLICSRNLAYDLSKDYTNNRFVEFIRPLYPIFKEWCKANNYRLAFQGEFIGEGIQKNLYKLVGRDWKIFDIYNLETKQYLSHDLVESIITELWVKVGRRKEDVKHALVPNLGIHFIQSIPDMLAFAEGKSAINPEVMREGLVYKTTSTRRVSDINSFKVISNSYLLKHE